MLKLGWSALAILTVLILWGGMRVLSTVLAYHPPDILEQGLAPSVFVRNDIQMLIIVAYLFVALVLFFLVFATVRNRLPGKRGVKGLVYGSLFGILWAIAFLSSIVFFETTLEAELINGIVDLIPLALAGWLAALIWASDTAGDIVPVPSHLLAIPVVGVVYVVVHSATLLFVDDPAGVTGRLMITPHNVSTYLFNAAVGGWAGAIYAVLRSSMPFTSVWARSGFFAAVVFGHSWLWFNMFFNILYADVLLTLLSMSLLDILGVFIGVIIYEHLEKR